MSDAPIRHFLEEYARALSAGDLPAISRCWEMPALVLSDAGAVAVAGADEVERFFSQAVASYHERGISATRPKIERSEQLGARLFAVDVSWSTVDAAGAEHGSERSHYILRADDDGALRIRVATTCSP